jgi:tubulin-specific chaperone E
MHECVIGERIVVRDKDGEHLAAVRYIGPIDSKSGVWVGVEWDDQSRGRHDGSVAGRRYFTCLRHPAASFIKQDKVRAGVGFHEAVRARYAPDVQDIRHMTIDTVGHRHLHVALRGVEKLSERLAQLNLLQNATMHKLQIARPVKLCQAQALTAPAVDLLHASFLDC